ncbi:MAG: transport system substrate-binding protein [Alphaproteobacteria bacterium]|nr:transport system substrate-binding protein [Alphaproteobacteria bacterium]
MEPKQNYLRVGVFVVSLVVAILGFVIWMAGSSNDEDLKTYQTFVSESVNGLTVGSAVKYRGVDVGQVTVIEISHRSPSKIHIVMQVLDNTPITKGTVAILQMQGITGIAYIELRGTVAGGEPIQTIGKNRLPIIPSAPSEFRQIVDTIPDMLEKFTEVANKLGKFASKENSERFSNILLNLEKFSTAVGGEDGNGNSLIKELQKAVAEMGPAAAGIKDIANNSREDTQRILKNTALTMDKIGRLTDDTGQLTQKSYNDLHELQIEIKKTTREIQSLSRNIKENPSQIIIPTQQGGVKAR